MRCPISNLPNLYKIMDKIVSEIVVFDIEESKDPSQCGNQTILNVTPLINLNH